MAQPSVQHSWEEKAAKKRADSAALIPSSWKIPEDVLQGLKWPLEESNNDLFALDIVRQSKILNERELWITEDLDVTTLLAHLADGILTAVEVTTAFSKRAAIAQQLTQCLTEILFDRAIQRAQELDRLRESGGTLGLLHGLPISLKDCFQIAGSQATIGLAAYLDNVSQKNSCLVDLLLDLGAVLYVKTNIPQTMMTLDSHNNVFGRTLNPHNTMLTAGGSSGGEGALIALRGAPLGVGTDVGGSIRIPASCCGIYGFKPSASRIPFGGLVACADVNVRQIQPVAGPMASDFKSLQVFVKAVLEAQPDRYDATALGFPWKSIVPKSTYRFGVLAEDPLFPLHPPVRKAVAETGALLQAQGHEVVHLQPQECRIVDAFEVALRLFSLDPTSRRTVAEGGEGLIPSIVNLDRAAAGIPWSSVPDLSSASTWQKLSILNSKRAEIAESWRRVWVGHGLDAVISPVSQHTAVRHDAWSFVPYTVLLNLLDYPGCVIPYGVDSGTHAEPTQTETTSAAGSKPEYEPEILKGSPLSIQVFTGRMKDEECLAIAEIVDACLKTKP